jgi:hypothetical protein
MSGGDPRVAVVMITHNRVEEVLRSLGHLAALPERPRVVLVDNASTDVDARPALQVDIDPAGGRDAAAAPVEAPNRSHGRAPPLPDHPLLRTLILRAGMPPPRRRLSRSVGRH